MAKTFLTLSKQASVKKIHKIKEEEEIKEEDDSSIDSLEKALDELPSKKAFSPISKRGSQSRAGSVFSSFSKSL